MLIEARAHSPTDPTVLNELGVVYMQLNRYHWVFLISPVGIITCSPSLLLIGCGVANRLQDAMKHLRKAAELVTSPSRTARRGGKEAGGIVEVREGGLHWV